MEKRVAFNRYLGIRLASVRRDVLWLCKRILKASGKRGPPQGSVIGPLWANVFLDDVDRMLEAAQSGTKQGDYEVVRYTRFADDLLAQVSSPPAASHWAPKVEQRLREEIGKLDLTVNEEKSRVVNFGDGESSPPKRGKKLAAVQARGGVKVKTLVRAGPRGRRPGRAQGSVLPGPGRSIQIP